MVVENGWRTDQLVKLCQKIGSGATPRGGKESYKSEGITLIRSQNVYNEGFSRSGLAFIDDEQAAQLDNVIVESGDVLLNITGESVCRVCQVPDDVLPARVNQHVVIIRPKSSLLDAKFLRYQMLTPAMQAYMNALSSAGATRRALTKGMIEELNVEYPPLSKQKTIAQILSTLDEKIELNRRMNGTLEQMARAIFKSWFVDFDPVRAKLDGRQPYGMDKATAALFPDSFEHTELGLVPKGWRFSALNKIIRIKHGYAFKGEYFRKERVGDILLTPGNFSVGGGFKGHKFKYYEGPIPEDYILKSDDLLVTMTDLSKAGDTLGYPMFVPPSHGQRFLHNQRLGKIELLPKQSVGASFVYFTMCTPQYRHHVLASASGSTVKHTSPDRIRAFETVLPANEIGQRFEQLVSPIHKRIVANDLESRTLVAIRDALLPKLLSGEIRVPDAEKIYVTQEVG